jgi:YD repeat-containing protein
MRDYIKFVDEAHFRCNYNVIINVSLQSMMLRSNNKGLTWNLRVPTGTTVATIASSTSITVSIPNLITMTGNTESGFTLVSGLPISLIGPIENMGVTGTGIPGGTIVDTVLPLTVVGSPGNTASGSATITGLTGITSVEVGMTATGTGIPAGARVISLGSSFSVIGSITNGSQTAVLVSMTGIEVGMGVSAAGIPAGTYVLAILSSTEITLSELATATHSFSSILFVNPEVTLSAVATESFTGILIEFTGVSVTLSAAATASNIGTSLIFSHSLSTLTDVVLIFAVLDSEVDLITQYAYNGVNSKISETDPNGNITTYAYDSIQRLVQIIDALGQVWLHDYSGPNTGASAFNSSDFKPTQITDPRGFRTWFVYDALYRTLSKNVEYEVTA